MVKKFRILRILFFAGDNRKLSGHAINATVLCLLTVAVQQIHCLLQRIQIELQCFPTWPALSQVRHYKGDLLRKIEARIIS